MLDAVGVLQNDPEGVAHHSPAGIAGNTATIQNTPYPSAIQIRPFPLLSQGRLMQCLKLSQLIIVLSRTILAGATE
jgi:hypothetical protein